MACTQSQDGKLIWTGTHDHLDPWPGVEDAPTTKTEITGTELDPSTTGTTTEKKRGRQLLPDQ